MLANRPDTSLAEHYAAALDWWRDAGVDCDFRDEAQGWLEEPQANQAAQPAKAAEAAVGDTPPAPAISAADLPPKLKDFCTWWSDAESPLPAGAGPRLAPRGEAGAKLMLLVPMPEAHDSEKLLAGPQGTMLANICRALNIAEEQAYFASALPSHMPLPDWQALGADGLGAALCHHIALAKPERVLLFGSNLPALLGHDPDTPPETFTQFEGIPALTTFAPDRLLEHKRQRARLWQRLLEWTAS